MGRGEKEMAENCRQEQREQKEHFRFTGTPNKSEVLLGARKKPGGVLGNRDRYFHTLGWGGEDS